ncbi:MAG: oxidoreductase [Leptospiraceae bacterium]|nr:oxidoreductase [Leptospiraceae bacterium]MCP5494790.1 oxidoreductase [Leptospiraceae bacterium]
MPQRKALVVGASGLIGNYCLELLLEDPTYNKISLVLRKYVDKTNSKLVQHIINFDKLEDFEPLDITDVYCCLGTTIDKAGSKENFHKVDYEYVVKTAQVAKKVQAKNFIVISAMGASQKSMFFYSQVKGEMEEAIKNMGLNCVHILRPSLLDGDRKEFRVGEQIALQISRLFSPLFIGFLSNYKPIHAQKVASAMIKYAKQNAKGTYIHESNEISEITNSV